MGHVSRVWSRLVNKIRIGCLEGDSVLHVRVWECSPGACIAISLP